MTPMDKAARAFDLAVDGGGLVTAVQRRVCIEAAITAYLQAIAEDAETVERVAENMATSAELDWSAMHDREYSVKWSPLNVREYWRDLARAALLALSTISGGEKT